MKEQTNEPKEESSNSVQAPWEKYKRNEAGLIESVNYSFNEDGSVNWRAMIKPEFLYPNKDWFDIRKLPVPSSIDGLEDKQLLIMLGGIKELAKLRGYRAVRYEVNNVRDEYVTAKCTIEWIYNYEHDDEYSIIYQDVANASASNTDDFCLKFLETIACNRAFVRCVRNFLNIHIVGADEIDKSKNKVADVSELFASTAIPITAQGALEKAVNEKLKISDFEGFKAYLRGLWKSAQETENSSLMSLLAEAKGWNQFKDISSKSSRVLLKVINENQKNNQP